MPGAISQLVSYGAQDVYLTGNPQITFFKSVYRRYTNFAMESIQQTFDGDTDFGKFPTVTISRNGDLAGPIWIEVTLPNLLGYDINPTPPISLGSSTLVNSTNVAALSNVFVDGSGNYWQSNNAGVYSNLIAAYSNVDGSYYTSTGEASLEKEMEAVAQVTGMPLTHSRQHFLRFQWPDTFRKLVQAGITHDHSMGYADQVGFRAGISISYPFFDLTQDEVLPLTVHPFAVMESVYRFKWRVPPAEALNDMRKIRDAVKSTGGKFVSVWHDKSLSRQGEGLRWAKAYATHLEWAKA
jgi:hypothetical protein